jgi:rare lipoprotein A (peptidoglycan hydrolase)
MNHPYNPFWKDLLILVLGISFGIVAGVYGSFHYMVNHLTEADYRHVHHGKASWYAASGMFCASRQFRVGSWVKVTYRNTFIIVQVTSRGPAWRYFVRGRIIDLTRSAFLRLENTRIGLIPVTVEEWTETKK